jgi:RNA polymerase sigma-70 factor, ECF subfamily
MAAIQRIRRTGVERQTRNNEGRMNAYSTGTHADTWDEPAMVTRLRSGDDAAFELLVRRYGGRMLAVARRLMRDEEEARDAVQDALLSAFRSMHRFEGGSQLGTWLHRIVVNSALMRLRSRRRHPECSIEELLPVFGPDGHRALRPEEEAGADEQLERDQLLALVRASVEQLPDGYREVYLLRDIDELSTEETATALGITPNAVKIRLHRARQALMTLVRKRMAVVTAPDRTT